MEHILELAKQAGVIENQLVNNISEVFLYTFYKDQLEDFANLIRQDEKYKFGKPVAWVYGSTLATKYKYNHVYLGEIVIPHDDWQPLYAKKG